MGGVFEGIQTLGFTGVSPGHQLQATTHTFKRFLVTLTYCLYFRTTLLLLLAYPVDKDKPQLLER